MTDEYRMPAEAPISLYFGLEEGQNADLEVLAKATAYWAEAVRSVALAIDPSLEVRVEFVSSEEGSVWLQNLIKGLRDGDPKALKAVAVGIILFFASGPALHLQADFGDKIVEALGHHDYADISDADKKDIADRVIKGLKESNLADKRREIITEVEKDQKITSIGVDSQPRRGGARYRIRREEFVNYHAEVPAAVPVLERKSVPAYGVDVEIVRPSLREGDDKPRWRFSQDGHEWSADLEDPEFVEALRSDQTGISLAIGKHMRVDLVIEQKLVGDEWKEENRRVVRVVSPAIARRQASLDLGEPKPYPYND